jgi:hypothetical protein
MLGANSIIVTSGVVVRDAVLSGSTRRFDSALSSLGFAGTITLAPHREQVNDAPYVRSVPVFRWPHNVQKKTISVMSLSSSMVTR